MKRSEMILLIDEYLADNSPHAQWSSKDLASDLLSKIEQAGMLPPERLESEELGYPSNSWEPELKPAEGEN